MGLFVESVHPSICRTIRQWCSQNQDGSPEDLAQKEKSLADLHGEKRRCDKPETVNIEDRRITYKNNQNRQSRGRDVMNFKLSSPQSSPSRCTTQPSTSASAPNVTAMSGSDLVAAVESSGFDLEETTSMDSMPFCRVCRNDNHKASKCQKAKNILSLNPTRNRTFEYLRNQQEGRS